MVHPYEILGERLAHLDCVQAQGQDLGRLADLEGFVALVEESHQEHQVEGTGSSVESHQGVGKVDHWEDSGVGCQWEGKEERVRLYHLVEVLCRLVEERQEHQTVVAACLSRVRFVFVV